MNYDKAEEYFSFQYKWHLFPETFTPLDTHSWIAKVTTTFRIPRGEAAESIFWIMYDTQTQQRYDFTEQRLRAIQGVTIDASSN